jgi:acyl transferase domain-containing protein
MGGRSAGDVDARSVAVIGLACRFPGAVDADRLWELLEAGLDATSETPAERYDVDDLYSSEAQPGTIVARRAGYLEGAGDFDAEFFGMSATEAAELDPQARLLLMTAWEAMEDAGQRPAELAGGRTGVYVGATRSDWLEVRFRQGLPSVKPSLFHNFRPMLPSRLSHAFDFRGPSILVDTACSSSLSAVHSAVMALRAGEVPVAMAAGVNIPLRPDEGVMMTQAGTLARDGRSKFGDAAADGYSPSDGVGVVLLKPLAAALADGDRIRAVIRGSAVGNDGGTSESLLVPSLQGQLDVLRWAYEDAGVAPAEVDFVEAHGTGSPAHDPVELNALGQVLGDGRPSDRPVLVGSVKTNIGHAEAAGSMAGLIKTVLCLEHERLPGSLHLEDPHPSVAWDTLPLELPAKPQDLGGRGRPLLAGVSGQGVSCLNAHLVLRQGETRAVDPALAPAPERAEEAFLLPLSARTPQALADLAAAYADYLSPGGRGSVLPLADVCWSAATRRQHHEHRIAVSGDTHEEIVEALRAAAPADGPGEQPGDEAGDQAAEQPQPADRRKGTLAAMAERYLGLRSADEKRREALAAAAERYLGGEEPAWTELFARTGRFVPLPHYAWQTRRYWVGETTATEEEEQQQDLASRVLAEHARIAYSDDSLLSEVGIDSLARLGIVLQLAEQHGLDVDIEDLAELRTVLAFREWIGGLEVKTA